MARLSLEPACTVIVATNGKRGRMLVRCLESLSKQESPPARVLCVSSTTDLPAATKTLAEVLLDDGRGASSGKNQALASVTTELVAFTDDDCVTDAGWLGALIRRFAARGGRLAAVTGLVLPTRAGSYLVRSEPYAEARTFSSTTLDVPPWKVGGGLNMSFRTEPLTAAGGFDPEFGPGAPFRSAEEIDLFFRLLAQGYEIDYDPKAIVYHEPLDSLAQIVRTRYAYRVGLAAFFLKHGRNPAVGALRRRFLQSEMHDAKAEFLKGQMGAALVSAYGLLGLGRGTLLARSRRRRGGPGGPGPQDRQDV